jgi:glycosyltransferase involved in cell wall biosynthesis
MRVLWFTNTPGNADEYYDEMLKGSGGWIKALDKELQLHVKLTIAFYHKKDSKFEYQNTTYYSIANDFGIFTRLYNRLIGSVPDGTDLDKYLAIIDEVKPDLIHIHGTENQFGCIIPQTKIPIVVSIQGNLTAILNKFFSGFEKRYLYIPDRKRDSVKDILAPWSFFVEYNFYKKIQKREIKYLSQVNYLMGRTAWDKRLSLILSPRSKYFHEDRILRDGFYINEWKVKSRDFVVIHTTIGNSFFKGFETICEALFILNEAGINCIWNLAGVNNSDLIVKITKKKLKDKFPEKGLVFLGMIDEKSLIENLLNSDMYVMSSHIENNANNLCEAMILGLPCISTFVGGVGSLINNNQNGIFIQDGDALAMAGAILELVNNKDMAIHLGKNARITALVRHSKTRILNQLLTSYKCILLNN